MTQMASFSWFPFLKAKSDGAGSAKTQEQPSEPTRNVESMNVGSMDFEALADRFEALQDELAYANDLCEQANIQFEKYRTEIYHTKQNMASLKQQLAHQTAMYNVLRAQADKHLIDLKKEKVLNVQLQARLATENNSLKAMTKQAEIAEQHLTEAKFDLEYLKCTTSRGDSQFPPLVPNDEAPLTPQPFVVVLVDGDAYPVSSFSPPEEYSLLTL